jgi:hypothetical protein
VDQTFQDTGRTYTDLEDIRIFSNKVPDYKLLWHRDREDRVVMSVGETDWMVQLDNDLPKSLNNEIFIPKGVYHRVIKGTGDLKIKIQRIG